MSPTDPDRNERVLEEPTTLSSSVPVAPLAPSTTSKPDRSDPTDDSTTTDATGEDQDSNITLHDAEPASSATVEKDVEKGERGGTLEEGEERYYSKEDGSEIIVVKWKGPDDPANPLNWSNGRRMTSTFM